jgi:hypothetical protein
LNVNIQRLSPYLLAERSDQKTSTQTLSSFLSPYLPEVAVDFVVLKHRWRWKEEEDATRAGRGGRHCCRRSRARQGTGGLRSRAMGRRLGLVPKLFSVGSRSCRERRRVVRVDDEGQFRAVHFRPKQTERWHPHELFTMGWILCMGPLAWEPVLLILEKGLLFVGYWTNNNWSDIFVHKERGSNQLLKLLYFLLKNNRTLWTRCLKGVGIVTDILVMGYLSS